MSDQRFENPSDFEKHIKLVLENREGWNVVLAEKNTKGYDMVAVTKEHHRIAIQVKNIKRKLYLPQIKKFEAFMEQPDTKTEFSGGIIISSSGFADTARTYIESEELKHIKLGTYKDGRIVWGKDPKVVNDTKAKDTPSVTKAKYIGVFTGKGGVGKTTVSAHLAGAFALCGYDVVLLDLDVQGNLRKLLGEGVYLPGPKGTLGAAITVLDYGEWDGTAEADTKIIVCDCNPEFDKNPKELMEKFDYCIIPTTLNPLGVNKNADVISRTFTDLRSINKNAELFVLINNFLSTEKKRNRIMNKVLLSNLKGIIGHDSKCHYIDPIEDLAIRYSLPLLYWGYETLIENKEPRLAFTTYGGRSHPRADFLSLAEYIVDHSDIEEIKKLESQIATQKTLDSVTSVPAEEACV